MELAGEALSWTHRGDALEVALHRGPTNEIGTVMLRELEGLVRYLEDGAGGARALILHSTLASGFCAGADLRELQAGITERTDRRKAQVSAVAERLPSPVRGLATRAARRVGKHLVRREISQFIDRIHAVFDALDRAPLLTIAVVHGPVFGGGFELALTADLIVAEKSARFCFPELRLGIIPGFGGIPRLERELGNAMTRDLLLTGRSLGARRAAELGLVAQVVSRDKGLDSARRVAAQAARFDAEVVAQAKAFLKHVPRQRLDAEKRQFLRMVTEDRVEAALTDFVARTDVRPYLP
ncbi:MAG: enoyl-CoA hydratase/isomerase family protein [Deltaproteobacteria bacterium]|nr:MAG: enoyl-CoA hydratase/isomerase family protein [Deltaproteobacteria bacterium]